MLRELTQKSKRAERPRPSHWEDRPSSKNAKNGNSWMRLKWIYLSRQLMNLNPIFRKWGAMLNGHWFRHPVSIAENSSGPVYPHRWWQALTMKIPLRSTKRITEINVKLPKGTRNPRHTATENIRPTLMTACDKRDQINTPPSTATHWVNLGSREQLVCSIPGSAMIQHRTHHRAGGMTQRSPCADTPIRSQLAKNRQTFSIKLSKYTLIA